MQPVPADPPSHSAPVEPPDFFISYTKPDRAWAEWIAGQLEGAGFKTILQAWDFRPGSNFFLGMQNAARTARRTIAVLSQAYLDSPFAMAEAGAAFNKDPNGILGKLVPVRIESFLPDGLFASLVYIDLVGINKVDARDRLLDGIQEGRKKPQPTPEHPDGVAFPVDDAALAATEESTVKVQVRVDFPSELIGVEPRKIGLTFTTDGPVPKFLLSIRQNAFLITGPDQAETETFQFRFDGPGKWRKELEVRAKEATDENHRVVLTCRDASGRVWTQKT